MLGSIFIKQFDDARVVVNMDILNVMLHLLTMKCKEMNNLGIVVTNFVIVDYRE
jgi:hypothetical protein